MDVIEGRGPAPALVVQLVMRLPDDSMTVALASGGREHFGWGRDRHLLADIFDAINQNTRASGNWSKGKAPNFDPYPRPKPASGAQKKKVSVADLFGQLNNRR